MDYLLRAIPHMVGSECLISHKHQQMASLKARKKTTCGKGKSCPTMHAAHSCTLMVLHNLAEPEWVSVGCNQQHLDTIYCQNKPPYLTWENLPHIHEANLTANKTQFCDRLRVVIGSSCFHFQWHKLKPVSTNRKETNPCNSLSCSLQNFQFLFEAVSTPFPPVFAPNLSHVSTFSRCCQTQKFSHIFNTSKEMQALHITGEAVTSKTAAGTLFQCSSAVHISMSLVCDGYKDCPSSHDDENGCECRNVNNYTSKCKFTVDESGRKTCSAFYIKYKSNICLPPTNLKEILQKHQNKLHGGGKCREFYLQEWTCDKKNIGQ